MSAPCTLRLYASSRSKCSSRHSSSSSNCLLRVKSVAKEEKARLRLEHIKKRQQLEREVKEKIQRHQEKEQKTKEELELLEAQQELKEASIERQILDEKIEHGGYIADPDTQSETDDESEAPASSLSTTSLPVEQINVTSSILRSEPTLPPTSERHVTLHQSQLQPTASHSTTKLEKVRANRDSQSQNVTSSTRNVVRTQPQRDHETRFATQMKQTSAVTDIDCRKSEVEETIPKLPQSSVDAHSNKSNIVDSALLSLKMSKLLELPKVEISKFSGNPMNYTKFVKTFESNVETFTQDSSRRLLLLIQHCEGKAKRLIEFCLLLDPEEGYLKAKDIFKENFGRRNVIARAYMDKLRSDVNIKADDEKAFVRLAHDLKESELTFRRLNLESNINNFEMMAQIVKRLPYQSQTR